MATNGNIDLSNYDSDDESIEDLTNAVSELRRRNDMLTSELLNLTVKLAYLVIAEIDKQELLNDTDTYKKLALKFPINYISHYLSLDTHTIHSTHSKYYDFYYFRYCIW